MINDKKVIPITSTEMISSFENKIIKSLEIQLNQTFERLADSKIIKQVGRKIKRILKPI